MSDSDNQITKKGTVAINQEVFLSEKYREIQRSKERREKLESIKSKKEAEKSAVKVIEEAAVDEISLQVVKGEAQKKIALPKQEEYENETHEKIEGRTFFYLRAINEHREIRCKSKLPFKKTMYVPQKQTRHNKKKPEKKEIEETPKNDLMQSGRKRQKSQVLHFPILKSLDLG